MKFNETVVDIIKLLSKETEMELHNSLNYNGFKHCKLIVLKEKKEIKSFEFDGDDVDEANNFYKDYLLRNNK